MLVRHSLTDVDDPRFAVVPEDVVFTEVCMDESAGLPVNGDEVEKVLEHLVRLVDGDVLETGARALVISKIAHDEDILQAVKGLGNLESVLAHSLEVAELLTHPNIDQFPVAS